MPKSLRPTLEKIRPVKLLVTVTTSPGYFYLFIIYLLFFYIRYIILYTILRI